MNPKECETKDAQDGDIAVILLHCRCMRRDELDSDLRIKTLQRPWAIDEFEIITKREFDLLVRLHDEMCSLKKV